MPENPTPTACANPPPLVLFADDDVDTLELYGFALALEGFRVEVSRDGNDAWAKVTTLLPHVVVTDLMLPGIDGFELCSQVKRNLRTRAIPVIAVSGMSGVQPTVGEAGFDAFILKPARLDSLVAQIRQTLAVSGS